MVSLSVIVMVEQLGEPSVVAGRIAQTHRECFVAFGVGIIGEGKVDGLKRFACREVHRADRRRVVATGRSVAVREVAIACARRVAGCVINTQPRRW